MADVLRIKRRLSGQPGAPTSPPMLNAEIAYNEVDDILWYGRGLGAGNNAFQPVAIAGPGMASTAVPVVNSGTVGNTGSLVAWSRGDHVHPSDPTRALASAVPAASTVVPLVDLGLGVIGTGTVYARGDHQHPVDITRAPLDNPVFTGDPRVTTSPINTDNDTSIASTAFVKGQRLDQFQPPTADVSFNGRRITGLADPPVASTDAATKNYVDLAIQGINGKEAVRVATTVNIGLSGTTVIDGVGTNAGDRVLVKDQTNQTQNGVWVVSGGGWTRAPDFDLWAEFLSAFVFVEEGVTQADNGYLCTVTNTPPGQAVGSNNITWTQFSSAGGVIAGDGLVKNGNSIDVRGTTNRILANPDSIDISPNYVGQPSITTLGTVTGSAVWNASAIPLAFGGTGVTALPLGYVQSNGTILSTITQFPSSAIAGLGSMALQNANAVAITGGTFGGGTGTSIVWDMGLY